MMDLQTKDYWPLKANSDHVDTWHSWSTNSRWILFVSKRDGGPLFARLYLSYIDENGRSHKPVLLPQKDPKFYDSLLQTYNAPELAVNAITVSEKQWMQAIRSAQVGMEANVISGASPIPQRVSPAGP